MPDQKDEKISELEEKLARLEWLVEAEPDIKEIVENQKRVQWFFAMARNAAAWVVAMIGAWMLLSEFVTKVIKGIAGAGDD